MMSLSWMLLAFITGGATFWFVAIAFSQFFSIRVDFTKFATYIAAAFIFAFICTQALDHLDRSMPAPVKNTQSCC